MRNTCCSRNERCTVSASSRAESRSWPNGFSITTRTSDAGRFSLAAPSRPTITGKKLEGVER